MTNDNPMIPVLQLSTDAQHIDQLLRRLRLDPVDTALNLGDRAKQSADVLAILSDVAKRGDAAVVDVARKFDDPNFSADQIRITPGEMHEAAHRVPTDQLAAIRHAIAQLREYQSHMMPRPKPPLMRDGVELGMRFTPLDSVGLHVPGGKAAYPSSLIHLAVPAQVAGVKKIVAVSPPSKYGRSDLMLATYLELGLTEVFRAGGAAAIGAMAFGTTTIPRVDKIVGPGNTYVQLAKRFLAGGVGVDGFLGPSEILTLADQVLKELDRQTALLSRSTAITKALNESSAIIIDPSMDKLIDLANRFAAEHVNLQTRDNDTVLTKLTHAGAIFVGPHSPVAAGDYVAGPSHCLPTNTTARFSSGISVYEFLKRSSVAKYTEQGLSKDSAAIIALANAEHLDAHAASIKIRTANLVPSPSGRGLG
ncbi:MAG TPA: histidinol dehydrogenase [Tepidisphaeraceae bacterium]|nr:histidinol dehydrogenase [Tepidisphaeraceae bacterium]